MAKKTAPIPGVPAKISGGPARIPGGPRGGSRGGKYDFSLPGVTWAGLDQMNTNINNVGKNVDKARKEAAEKLGRKMYAYATFNAPWHDRTLQARLQLQYKVFHNDAAHTSTIVLSHGVDYGIHLETMQGGAFAIIMPTIIKFQSEMGGEIRASL